MSLTATGASKFFTDGLFSTAVHAALMTSASAEMTGTAYARVSIDAYNATPANSGWVVAGGSAKNRVKISWPAAGSGGWSAPVGVRLYDAATGGNALTITANFSTPPGALTAGSTIEIPAQSFTITVPTG